MEAGFHVNFRPLTRLHSVDDFKQILLHTWINFAIAYGYIILIFHAHAYTQTHSDGATHSIFSE